MHLQTLIDVLAPGYEPGLVEDVRVDFETLEQSDGIGNIVYSEQRPTSMTLTVSLLQRGAGIPRL